MDCEAGFGAATMVTATFGFVAVAHALKKFLARVQRRHERLCAVLACAQRNALFS